MSLELHEDDQPLPPAGARTIGPILDSGGRALLGNQLAPAGELRALAGHGLDAPDAAAPVAVVTCLSLLRDQPLAALLPVLRSLGIAVGRPAPALAAALAERLERLVVLEADDADPATVEVLRALPPSVQLVATTNPLRFDATVERLAAQRWQHHRGPDPAGISATQAEFHLRRYADLVAGPAACTLRTGCGHDHHPPLRQAGLENDRGRPHRWLLGHRSDVLAFADAADGPGPLNSDVAATMAAAGRVRAALWTLEAHAADEPSAAQQLARAESRWALGDAVGSVEALRLVDTDDPTLTAPQRARCLVVRARHLRTVGHDPTRAVRAARLAGQVVGARSATSAAAAVELVKALAVQGDPDALREAERLVGLARADGDLAAEVHYARAAIHAALALGRPDRGRDLAIAVAERCRQGGDSTNAVEFAVVVAWDDIVRQLAPARAAEHLDTLLRRTRHHAIRQRVAAPLALALADLGDADEARAALRRLRRVPPMDAQRASWLTIEAEIALGAHDRAVRAGERALARMPVGSVLRPFVENATSWARLLSGADPRVRSTPDPAWTVTATARPIHATQLALAAAHRAASPNERRDVAGQFVQLAERWRTTNRRMAVRCSWAAADLLAGAGERAAAEGARAELAQVAATHQLAWLAKALEEGSAGGSMLVAAGLPGSERRGVEALTKRQVAVLELVAQGHSTRAIAALLDIAPRTVEAHIESGRQRLGARTRIEAVAVVARSLASRSQQRLD